MNLIREKLVPQPYTVFMQWKLINYMDNSLESFFESKKVEVCLMFREAGLAEEDMEKGEAFFDKIVSGYWTSFEEYQKHFYSAFALFKILETTFMGLALNDIKRIVLESGAGVSMTIMQEAPQIFAKLSPLFMKLNEKYERMTQIMSIISIKGNVVMDPTMDSFMDVDLIFQQLAAGTDTERQLAFIAITEIIEQITNMIQPFQEREYAKVMRDLFRLVQKFDIFSIYEKLQKSSECNMELKLENEEKITGVLESERLKENLNVLKEYIKTIDYDLQVIERNHMEGLLTEQEYELKKYRLKEKRKEIQSKVFEINFKLLETMSGSM